MPGDAPAPLRTPEDEPALKGVSFFARGTARRSIEKHAAGAGVARVGVDIMREAKAQHHAG